MPVREVELVDTPGARWMGRSVKLRAEVSDNMTNVELTGETNSRARRALHDAERFAGVKSEAHMMCSQAFS